MYNSINTIILWMLMNTIFYVSYSYLNADTQTYCYIKRTTCQATVGLALLHSRYWFWALYCLSSTTYICFDGEIEPNKTILSMRSQYFRSMFSSNNNFVESQTQSVKQRQDFSSIKHIFNVGRFYFNVCLGGFTRI